MKNFQVITLIFLVVSISHQGCSQEPSDTAVSEEYKSCCGVESVEFEIPQESIYVYVPNAFTPNEDGLNDRFMPVLNDQIQTINYLVIERAVNDDTTSTLLYQVKEIDAAKMPQFAWDGKNPLGVLHKGAFNYTMSITTVKGVTYSVIGKGCSIVCGPDASIFKDKTGCFYSEQAGGNGHLDMSISNSEENCFK